MKTLLKLLIVLFLFATLSFAEILNVPSEKYPTIQAGIDSALTGDTVLVAEDTYYENINFNGKAITVASHFILDEHTSNISNTIIDGSQPTNPDSGSVVYFCSGEDTTSVLCGFTITNGTGTNDSMYSPNGGGIYIHHSGASLLNNNIINNSVLGCGSGGGIYSFFSNIKLQYVTIFSYN